MIPNTTTGHIDFNDWLEHCPLRWQRVLLDEDEVTYVFTLPLTEEEEEQ